MRRRWALKRVGNTPDALRLLAMALMAPFGQLGNRSDWDKAMMGQLRAFNLLPAGHFLKLYQPWYCLPTPIQAIWRSLRFE